MGHERRWAAISGASAFNSNRRSAAIQGVTLPHETLSRPLRAIAGIAAALVCPVFALLGLAVLGAGANLLLVVAVLGSLGGCLLDAALFGCPRPWRSFWCLPLLYALQVGSVLLALNLFPHHPAAHIGFCLTASGVFVVVFHRAGYFGTDGAHGGRRVT